jgi:ArsR family transcriptional regulator
MTQSAVSHQLKNLKQASLIKSRREGQTIYYRLSDDHVHLIFNQALDHIQEFK